MAHSDVTYSKIELAKLAGCAENVGNCDEITFISL